MSFFDGFGGGGHINPIFNPPVSLVPKPVNHNIWNEPPVKNAAINYIALPNKTSNIDLETFKNNIPEFKNTSSLNMTMFTNSKPITFDQFRTYEYTYPSYIEGQSTNLYGGHSFYSHEFRFPGTIREKNIRARLLAIFDPVTPNVRATGFIEARLQHKVGSTYVNVLGNTVDPANNAIFVMQVTDSLREAPTINTIDTYRWMLKLNTQSGDYRAHWYRLYLKLFID